MPDPSRVPLGSRAGYTTDGDIALAVPAAHGAQYPSALTPFENYAASVLAEMQKTLRRLRSQRLFTDKFDATGDWTCTKQKVRLIGEVWGYGEFDLERTGSVLSVPDDGNLPSEVVGTLDELVVPRSLARLTSVNTSVMAVGYVLADGSVKLSAMNSGTDIVPGQTITLAGRWPLLNVFDSEA